MSKFTWYYKGMKFDNESAKLYAAGVRDVPRMVIKGEEIWGRAGRYLKITRNPDKMTYYYGDTLDLSGIRVSLIDTQSKTETDVTSSCIFDPADGETVLAPKVKITFDDDGTELTASLKLTVDYPENVIASGSWWTLFRNGLLYIYRVGTMPNYTKFADIPWYSRRSYVTSVMIKNTTTSIGSSTFNNCTRLTSVTIPDSVTSIGVSAFYGCSRLTSATIPDSVTSIRDSAFNFCTRLTSVTIPDSVTSISDATFRSCSSLTSVTIPDSVTSIGISAFYGCSSLTDVYYAGTEAQWNAIRIRSYNEPLTRATIHYNSTGPT